MYVFWVSKGGIHYYFFAVKTGGMWRVVDGEYYDKQVLIKGEMARTIAEVINAVYKEKGHRRRVKLSKDSTPYIKLTDADLRLLKLEATPEP